MWEQLQLAYSYGVDKVWILNVGDLKPNEYPMDFFLNMAWNPTSFSATNLDEYTRKYTQDHFGKEQAAEAAEILICIVNIMPVFAEMLDERTHNLRRVSLQVRDAYLRFRSKS